MALARFPADCRALVVEDEPLQAFALECLLEELGCQPVGPARTVAEVDELLARDPPSFALVEINLRGQLPALADRLDRGGVPFALLAVGADGAAVERLGALRGRPRLTRPFHAPSLHAAASALYRVDLDNRLARADREIAGGRLRLARQLRLIERLASAGQDTAAADALAREFGRVLRTMRASRRLLERRLDGLPA